jgi:predicted O-methyltransferase YrrM
MEGDENIRQVQESNSSGSKPADDTQPLSLAEVMRRLSPALSAADIDQDNAAAREHITGQQTRLLDLKRQHAEAEIELAERHRQLFEQKSRAADLERQHGLVASGIVRLKFVLRRLRSYLLAQERSNQAVSTVAATLNFERERMEQSSRIEDLSRLTAEQEALVAVLHREIASQCGRLEHDLAQNRPFEEQPLMQLARSYRRDPWWPELQSLRRISMLHFETLYLLRALATLTSGAIIEVGPYLGGSTIALGRGLQIGGGGPLICIEMGGSYPNHALPTDNIIADLRSNIETYGLTDIVHIVEGFTTDAAVEVVVNRILDGRTIGLLFLDADGNVERDFELYRRRLSPGAILVYDDYLSDEAPEKQSSVKAWVDQAVASRVVENLGLYRWGTWIGRYSG